jgi:hypothetical protein
VRATPSAPPPSGSGYSSRQLLQELTHVADRLGIKVRFEALSSGVDLASSSKGGLCTLRGVRLLVVDSRLGVEEQVGVVAEALATCNLESMYMPPAVRARVRRRNVPVRPLPRPLARARLR